MSIIISVKGRDNTPKGLDLRVGIGTTAKTWAREEISKKNKKTKKVFYMFPFIAVFYKQILAVLCYYCYN